MLNGVQGMIGETAVVTKADHGAHHPGSIRARGEDWLAIPLDPSETIEPGASVVVADIQRGFLVVYTGRFVAAVTEADGGHHDCRAGRRCRRSGGHRRRGRR